jgi:excisionase family DNA binding protein
MTEDGHSPPPRRRFDVRQVLERFGPTMSVPQLAELLNVSAENIRQKAASGELPGRKLPGGRQYFFFTEELVEVLEASLVSPVDAAEEATGDERAGTT